MPFSFGAGFGWPYPYAYPYGYAYPPYAYAPPPSVYAPPDVTTGSLEPSGEPVIVNQYFSPSAAATQAPGAATQAAGAATQPLFLIAFKNGGVDTALAYWVDNGTLHYISPQGNQLSAPLSQVDRARSQQLNRQRGMPFGLPDGTGAAR